jgi:superfamily II DNA or RNA helicase
MSFYVLGVIMSIAGIIDQAFASTSQKNIVIVEIPPGIGKTLYAVRKAYRRAKKGLVIYTANTHAGDRPE